MRPLAFSNYTVRGTQSYSCVITASAGVTDRNFAFAPASATGGVVSGFVFSDANGNGLRDTGESGIAGRQIYLDLNSNGVFDAATESSTSTLTMAGGGYALRSLAAGSYAVRQVNPTGWSQSLPASNAPRTATITGSNVVSGQTFGSTNVSGSIYGTLYTDGNDNGTFDVGDSVGSGRRAYVDLNNDGAFQSASEPTAVSDTLGSYTIAGLVPGTYIVRQVVLSGYRQTQPASSAARTVTLVAGQTLGGQDFGQTPIAPTTEIAGTVFSDANGNTVRDAGESGIAGATVYIDSNNNGVFDSATEKFAVTDSLGAYRLIGMYSGTYAIRQVVPPGSTQTLPASNAARSVTIYLNGYVAAADFGRRTSDTAPPTISSGVVSVESAVRVSLTFSEAISATSLSAADLIITNLQTSQVSTASAVTLDTAGVVATFTLPPLVDGTYRFRLPSGAVNDLAGNANTTAFDVPAAVSFILGGDANRDRSVNFTDLLVLASNYNQSSRTFSQGDFNYDGTVNFADLLLLAANYGVALAASSPAGGAATFSAVVRSDESQGLASDILA
ncbi:MAG: SdrD B-like domain-containing protein [Tepidisphaeraceae bacterium]